MSASRPLCRRALLQAVATTCLVLAAEPLLGRERPKRVLLVCQFGSVKSAIARELTRRRARERGLELTVRSRGITPEAHLNPVVKERLAADGIDPGSAPLRALTRADLAWADRVIIFNALPPRFGHRRVTDWSDTPSMNDDYAHARAEFDRRIEALLDSFQRPRR